MACVRAKCIPRKSKTVATKKEGNMNGDICGENGSKKHEV